MATRTFYTNRNKGWMDTGLSAPCIIESNKGDVLVATATSIEDLDDVDGLLLEEPFKRITLDSAAGTVWFKSYIRNSSVTITPF